jgi:peptidoglycan/LPS O-acetylase OafA/YrhL
VTLITIERLTPSGDEAGTAPGDRAFRPDVQGLRAVAILLVVLYHAGVPGITGGFVGVDVFFVISGFVITGVLLRQREATGRTSVVQFYGRRARRIIPAASLVIVVTVIAAYYFLGPLTGQETAVDGKWAALFLANFHFAASSTNYLASQQPPSALQNYWSLAVEEQFYVIYPTLFLVTAHVARRMSLRARLTVVLVVVIAASYAYSIILTPTNAPLAFFSPFTRAWELALGGLIAVSSPSLQRLPQWASATSSWVGIVAIVLASLTLTSATVYPGTLVILPVVGAGLVIAGGVAQPAWGAEWLLRLKPFQLLGLISYSLYLWHWPILIIATQRRGVASLPVWDNVGLLVIATAAATVTYLVLENPVRHSRFLRGRRWASIALGLCLVGGTLVVTTYEQRRNTVDLGPLGAAQTGSACPVWPSTISQLRTGHLNGHQHAVQSSGSQDTSVVAIGDSTTCTLLQGLQAVGPFYGFQFHDGSVIGCGIVSGELAPAYVYGRNFSASTIKCQGEANRVEEHALEAYAPRLVVWGSIDEQYSVEVRTTRGGKVLVSGTPAWTSAMEARINTRIDSLLAAGTKIIILLEPPSAHKDPGIDSSDVAYARLNALLRQAAARHPGNVGVVDLEPRVCPSGPPCEYQVPAFNPLRPHAPTYDCGGMTTTAVPCRATLRPDGLHYLAGGAVWVAEWLVPRLAAEAKALLNGK